MAETSAPQTQAIAPRGQRGLRDVLYTDRFRDAVSQALPAHLKPERFIRVAITALTRTPKLQNCTEESFVKCLMDLSMYGLEPDGRRAHLIPFDNKKAGTTECTLIIDWKGIAECIMRSGLVSYLHADVVYEGDIFEYSMGEIKAHIPWYLRRDADKPKDKGKRYAAYSIAKMKDGTSKCEVMSSDQILSIRDNSQGWKAFQKKYTYSSPWDPANESNEGEMWKKTSFKRLSKWLPLSAELRDVVEYGDDDVTITVDKGADNRRPLSHLLRGQEVEQAPSPIADDTTGDGPSVEQIREQVLDELRDRAAGAGVSNAQMQEYTGRAIADWTEDDLASLNEKLGEIESGMRTVEDIFGK